MRSTLFSIPVPEFLQGFLPSSIPIFGYGLMILLAYLTVTSLCVFRAKKYNIDKEIVQDLTLSILLAGIIGARIAHIALYSHQYESFVEIFKIWNGGLVLYGFLLTAPLMIWYKLKKHNISWDTFFAIFLPPVPLGIGIGRLGCFLNGCCYGKPGEASWCVTFPAKVFPQSFLDAHGHVPIHPTQLYAFFLGLILSVLLMKLPTILTQMKGREIFTCFLLGYGIIRLLEESFRADTPNHFFNSLTAGQGISVLMIVASIIYFIISSKNQKV